MRESNFAFPAQNRACVCITAQLYDRRALDTNSPLPLFNSLTHLTYLTSTSPRIREIMTMDGGLERLVQILHDFCICPPPPENPNLLYGLSPPTSHPPQLTPTLNPRQFDKHAAYRFSLAFQSVVNIGVRGSEPIRSRVVQAGTLDVVGCILEAWLAGKGFAVGPSTSASGMPRETKEQRMIRRQAMIEQRQREMAANLARALQRQVRVDNTTPVTVREVREDELMDIDIDISPAEVPRSDNEASTDTSVEPTPLGSNTPTGSVDVPGRDRSGTVIARPVWDNPQTAVAATHNHRRHFRTRQPVPNAVAAESADTSADTSRAETETEDDGDVDMDRESGHEGSGTSTSVSPSPERTSRTSEAGTVRPTQRHTRRAVGIVSDTATTAPGASLDMNTDAHIIINEEGGVEGVGVEDGIVSLDANDDFALGAPPGAPGAIDGPTRVMDAHGPAGERTPRAATNNLPTIPILIPPVPTTTLLVTGGDTTRTGTNINVGTIRAHVSRGTNNVPENMVPAPNHHHHHHHTRDPDAGPYRDEDVLLSLQLLAYLSKYPHVRQAFYKPRTTFHPGSAQLANEQHTPVAGPSGTRAVSKIPDASTSASALPPSVSSVKEPNAFMKAFASATGRGKEKEREKAPVVANIKSTASTAAAATANPPRMTNVFSLVERFTFRPSSSEIDLPNPPPTLPPEIQYWAGVIMRNACRKDESRGGIRQCANMLCGKWESFPREFAKCRRCRKAKYCGKECQSTAWSEGHRFWCSAKDTEEDAENQPTQGEHASRPVPRINLITGVPPGARIGVTPDGAVVRYVTRGERRPERERPVTVDIPIPVATMRPPRPGFRGTLPPIGVNPRATSNIAQGSDTVMPMQRTRAQGGLIFAPGGDEPIHRGVRTRDQIMEAAAARANANAAADTARGGDRGEGPSVTTNAGPPAREDDDAMIIG